MESDQGSSDSSDLGADEPRSKLLGKPQAKAKPKPEAKAKCKEKAKAKPKKKADVYRMSRRDQIVSFNWALQQASTSSEQVIEEAIQRAEQQEGVSESGAASSTAPVVAGPASVESSAVDTDQPAGDSPLRKKPRVGVEEVRPSFANVHGDKVQLLASLEQFADLGRMANAQLVLPLLQDHSRHAIHKKCN